MRPRFVQQSQVGVYCAYSDLSGEPSKIWAFPMSSGTVLERATMRLQFDKGPITHCRLPLLSQTPPFISDLFDTSLSPSFHT